MKVRGYYIVIEGRTFGYSERKREIKLMVQQMVATGTPRANIIIEPHH